MTRPISSRNCEHERAPACGAEAPALGNRRAHDPACRLCDEPAHPKRIEEAFGWIKTMAGLRKTRFSGRAKDDWAFTFAAAAYNLVRLPKLLAGRHDGAKEALRLAAPFQGRWRIAEMDLWDDDALDLVGPAFIDIQGQEGEMRFIAVTAWLDIRYEPAPGARSPSSPGRASTRATNDPAAAGSCPAPPDASSATSLLPYRRRFRLRMRAWVGSSTAC